MLDSAQHILQSCQKWIWIPFEWSCQKWFWIPLKLFYGHVRNDFGFHLKYFGVMYGGKCVEGFWWRAWIIADVFPTVSRCVCVSVIIFNWQCAGEWQLCMIEMFRLVEALRLMTTQLYVFFAGICSGHPREVVVRWRGQGWTEVREEPLYPTLGGLQESP